MNEYLYKGTKTISEIQNKKILLISAIGITPHIETSLEICQRLVVDNELSYINISSLLPYSTLYSTNIIKKNILLRNNILMADRYIKQYIYETKNMSLLNIAKIKKVRIKDSHRINNLKDKNLSDIKKISYQGYNIGEGLVSTIVSILQDSDPFPLNRNEERLLNKIYISSMICIEATQLLLKENNYDTAVLFNGRYACEYAIKQVLKEQKINIFYHERGWCENYYFFENYVPNDMSMRKKEILSLKLKFSNDEIDKLGKQFFKRRREGDGISWISFNKNHSNNISKILKNKIINNKKKGKKIISYFTSNEDEFISLEGIKEPFLTWGNQFEAIKDLGRICRELNLYLIIRSHPNLQYKSIKENSRWSRLKEEIKKLNFEWINSYEKESSYELINNSDLIITGGSTIGVEAVAMGKPSLVITECHYDNIFESILFCQNKTELLNILKDINTYKPVDKNSVNLFGLWSLSYGTKFINFLPDGLFDGKMKNGFRINKINKIIKSIKKFINI